MAIAMKQTVKTALTAQWGVRGRLCSTLTSSFPFNPPPLADADDSSKRPKNDPSTNLFISAMMDMSGFGSECTIIYSLRPTGLTSVRQVTALKNLLQNSAKWFQVVTDRATGYSKGFGFVDYASLEDADKGIKGMDAKFLDGWVIFAEYARPREAFPQNNSGQFQSRRY